MLNVESYENLLSLVEDSGHARPPRNKGSGRKSTLQGFSRKSRYSLAKQLSKVGWPIPPTHITLTYAVDYPDFSNADAKTRVIDSLTKWFTRQGCTGVWRLEFQQRGAPHFHLLVCPFVLDSEPPHMTKQEQRLRKWWAYQSGNASHYAVDVRYGEAGRAAWYLALHTSKAGDQSPDLAVGRWWGKIAAKKLAELQTPIRCGDLSSFQSAHLARIARRLSKKKIRPCRRRSYSLFMSQHLQMRVLRWLATLSRD